VDYDDHISSFNRDQKDSEEFDVARNEIVVKYTSENTRVVLVEQKYLKRLVYQFSEK